MNEQTAGTTRAQPWIQLTPGFVLVAGLLHVLLVEAHMAHARGAGLFFLILGIAQMLWAIAYMRTPGPNLRIAGLAALTVAPTILYTATRLWRAPWAPGPEPVDIYGMATIMMQLAAGAGLIVEWQRAGERGAVSFKPAQLRVIAAGVLLGIAGYSGALSAEDVEWLGTAEAAHGHDAGLAIHGDHPPNGPGQRGISLVGSAGYYGPATAQGILDHCTSIGEENTACWGSFLQDRLLAFGSIDAFDELVTLISLDADADRQSHTIAHQLGRFAYEAYGYDITLTLGECSYEVFQGCLHGALQVFFDDVAASGQGVDAAVVRSTCAAAASSFEVYACLHGVGHGVMLYTNYKLHESLDLCSLLKTNYGRGSCYGGVFMENVVGYADSLNPNAAGGHQGHGGHNETPVFWVDAEIPEYPCNVVKADYAHSCWRMQTSLILRFNQGDFDATAAVCEALAEYRLGCYNSMGRDAASYTGRDPAKMSQHCSQGDEDAQTACVEGFSAGEVLQANDPDAGLILCAALPVEHKEACYREVGQQAGRMLSKEHVRVFCDGAPQAYVAVCREGERI